MFINNKSVLGAAAVVLLSLASQISSAQGLLPGHHQATNTGLEEPRYQDLQPQTQSLALAACDTNGYANNSGQALVEHIMASDWVRINDLFDGDASSFTTFTPEKVIAVSNAAALWAGTTVPRTATAVTAGSCSAACCSVSAGDSPVSAPGRPSSPPAQLRRKRSLLPRRQLRAWAFSSC